MYKTLTGHYEEMRKECEAAARKCGLDFYDTDFYVTDFETLNQVIANIGFPVRYSHWRFGMDYEKMQKQYGHGFGRVYELVVNNNPSVAYLLEYNLDAQQKMVMAHVYGHVDFFKNNVMFRNTNRGMLRTMEEHGKIIDRIKAEEGLETVEEFIDACLSLEDLIDPDVREQPLQEQKEDDEKSLREKPKQANIPEYMKLFIKGEKKEEKPKKIIPVQKKIPAQPQRDVLKFLMEHGDALESWQKDIIAIIRDESYYFLPQKQTKIMNEGWATFWHDYIMTDMGLAGPQGIVEYGKTMGGVISPAAGMNPYRLGYLLYRDIKDRWDKGRHGEEYENEKDYEKKLHWDTKEGKGFEKIFQVRAACNDAEFIRTFMTDDFIRKMIEDDKRNQPPSEEEEEEEMPEPREIRVDFVNQLTNFGEPVIVVDDGNYQNTGQLVLRQEFIERELDPNFRDRTMRRLFDIWKRPVNLITLIEDEMVMLNFNGEAFSTKKM